MSQILDLELIEEILRDVQNERIRQFREYGPVENKSWGQIMVILGEEYGESCQAVSFEMSIPGVKETDKGNTYSEFIQVAASALQGAEKKLKEQRYGSV